MVSGSTCGKSEVFIGGVKVKLEAWQGLVGWQELAPVAAREFKHPGCKDGVVCRVDKHALSNCAFPCYGKGGGLVNLIEEAFNRRRRMPRGGEAR